MTKNYSAASSSASALESHFPLKVLFICSRNRRRSLTAEHVFKNLPGLDIRSAGTQPSARILVTAGLLGWADLILVMEKSHLRKLQLNHPGAIAQKKVITLHIRDEFEFMQPELIDELQARALPILFSPRDLEPDSPQV